MGWKAVLLKEVFGVANWRVLGLTSLGCLLFMTAFLIQSWGWIVQGLFVSAGVICLQSAHDIMYTPLSRAELRRNERT